MNSPDCLKSVRGLAVILGALFLAVLLIRASTSN